jgi:hypothetical protein
MNSRNAMRVAGDEAGAGGDDIDVDGDNSGTVGAEIVDGATEIVAEAGNGTASAGIVDSGAEIAVNGAEIVADSGSGISGTEIVAGGTEIVIIGAEIEAGASNGPAGAEIVVGGAKIVADDATWLLDDETDAGSCFLPFLAMGECWRAENPSIIL